ncbi:MAG: hypothetical protein IT209_09275 [Armatimonadetes bacterium]|nr:hypothetical protein [Armatimonadota bacterium]
MQNIADIEYERFVEAILNTSRSSRHLAQETCALVCEVNEHTQRISWALGEADYPTLLGTRARRTYSAGSAS